MAEKQERLIWVDNVKVIACILVVLGHFFQSMVKSDIVPESGIYNWFNQTIYTFHVPLFFICSGFLYQTYSKVNSLSAWKSNILKKALDLGVPFFTFTTITWILKTVFASQVNSKADSLFYSFFVDPIPPYWFLLSLLIMFALTPTFEKKRCRTLLLLFALALKLGIIFFKITDIPVFYQLLTNYFWFATGIKLTDFDLASVFKKKSTLITSIIVFTAFLAGSILIFSGNIYRGSTEFPLGFTACISIIGLIGYLYSSNRQTLLFGISAKYTMPVFLMHTIFAATLRALLFKLSVTNPAVHISLGLLISFAGPVIAAIIMNKTIYPEFFLYPNRTIKRIKKGNTK